MDFDGERAAAVKPRDEPALVGVHAPFLAGIQTGQRHGAGEQFQRAALGVFHLGGAGEGEGRRVPAQIAGEFEVLKGDARAGSEAEE